MNQFKTFKDVEDFLLDYNDDGTPIKNNTYICKSTKKIPQEYINILNLKFSPLLVFYLY